MPRQAENHVKVWDGQLIGYGWVFRDEKKAVYSVQFFGPDGKRLIRSTGETARPRAEAKAEQIINEHYPRPGAAEEAARQLDWDGVTKELERHLRADNARPDTIRDYLDTMNQVRSAAVMPAALSHGLAQQWCNAYLTGTFTASKKEGAKQYTRSPRTLHSRVRKLRAIWNKYIIKRMRVATENPWASVDLPKLDRLPVRRVSEVRVGELFDWLEQRWMGWRLPVLFFETKAVTGCRLQDLCNVGSDDLLDGHQLRFKADKAKARAERVAVLPADLWTELKKLSGRTYLWESYSTDMGEYLRKRGVPGHRVNTEFDPRRMYWWILDEVDDFNKAHPDQPKFKSHDFRKRAVTAAYNAGLTVDTAASGVGMTAANARLAYLALEQAKAAATVSATIGDTLRRPRPSANKD